MKIQTIQQLSLFQLKKLFYYLHAENGRNAQNGKNSKKAGNVENAGNTGNAEKCLKRSKREIAAILGISRDSVRKYEKRFIEANLVYPASNEDLEAILVHSGSSTQKIEIDFAAIRNQQDLYPKATVRALYDEWAANRNPDEGIVSYSQFAKRFRQYNASLRISLRNQHRVAESVFVDYSGNTVPIYCVHTGKVLSAV